MTLAGLGHPRLLSSSSFRAYPFFLLSWFQFILTRVKPFVPLTYSRSTGYPTAVVQQKFAAQSCCKHTPRLTATHRMSNSRSEERDCNGLHLQCIHSETRRRVSVPCFGEQLLVRAKPGTSSGTIDACIDETSLLRQRQVKHSSSEAHNCSGKKNNCQWS